MAVRPCATARDVIGGARLPRSLRGPAIRRSVICGSYPLCRVRQSAGAPEGGKRSAHSLRLDRAPTRFGALKGEARRVEIIGADPRVPGKPLHPPLTDVSMGAYTVDTAMLVLGALGIEE